MTQIKIYAANKNDVITETKCWKITTSSTSREHSHITSHCSAWKEHRSKSKDCKYCNRNPNYTNKTIHNQTIWITDNTMSHCKLDCGMIVCYIMTQIARCKTVHNHLVQRVVNSFSAELAVKFLHDEPRSWTKEDFEAKKFASLKEGWQSS